jgi:uridine kinase
MVFEKEQQKRIFRQKAEKIIEEWSKIRKEYSQFIFFTKYYGDHIKDYEIDRTYLLHAGGILCK